MILNFLYDLLPAWAVRLIEPEIDDLTRKFSKLEAGLNKVLTRHEGRVAALEAVKAEIKSEIADTAAEIERAKRIAARVAALLD